MSVELIIIFILIIASIAMLVFFAIATRKINNNSNNNFKTMPLGYSQGVVDIENRVVYVQGIKGSDSHVVYSVELDTFIYNISINNDSLTFRELLKEINIGSSKEKIKEKLSLTKKRFISLLNHNDTYKTITIFELNPTQDFSDKINFQIVNTRISTSKNDTAEEFVKEPIETHSESQIFTFLFNESKKITTRGATFIKIQRKDSLLSSKDSLLNHLNLLMIKYELKLQGVKSIVSKFGNLYGIIENKKNRTAINVNKSWESKFNLILLKSIEGDFKNEGTSNFEIYTSVSQVKDSNSINIALIELNIYSSENIKITNKNKLEIYNRAVEINNNSEMIVKDLKSEAPSIRTDIKEIEKKEKREINNLVEVYIDYSDIAVNSVYKYSYRHKKEILDLMIKVGNKISLNEKYKNDFVVISISNTWLHEINLLKIEEDLNDNFYLLIQEEHFENYRTEEINNVSSFLKFNNIKTIQYIKNNKGGNIELFRSLNPNLILFERGLTDNILLSDLFVIRYKTLEKIKSDQTQILNLK